MSRKVLLKTLVGSRNYNLDTEESDRDYKVFVAPTFNDLYSGNQFKENILTDAIDEDIKDIRQLPVLLWKSNISYLEILFSKEIIMDLSNDSLRKIFKLKDEIVKMNLPQLFNSTGGMFNRRMKLLDKGTDGTQHLVDKYGYNTKEAMHMFRTLFILVKYYHTGFRYFKDCLRHTDSEREMMLDIKHGKMTRDEFIKFINAYHDKHFAPLKSKYHEQEPREDLRDYINNLVEDVVETSIFEELYENSH